MIAAGGAGDILRGSSGKTNAVVFSAVQPHRLGVLKAALNALVAEERILTAPWSLPRWYRPSKRLLRASRPGDWTPREGPGSRLLLHPENRGLWTRGELARYIDLYAHELGGVDGVP